MAPTLHPGTIAVVQAAPNSEDGLNPSLGVKHGEVVVLNVSRFEGGAFFTIKRIVGMPRDTLQVIHFT